ncbi:hypothetical protein CCACVL1_26222 [Corchorus capsularis]|uniref:Uncharacterized protein n=1 Tax=Corchorus capsularis TaxID=210143 RepID=A0A1R3GFI0_COCAP|nr:hypothetical protein CCACVL1_26222 [Corchorus capsularis]
MGPVHAFRAMVHVEARLAWPGPHSPPGAEGIGWRRQPPQSPEI